MRIISFAWTTPAIRARVKTCTRRDWKDGYAQQFHAGDLLAGYDRSPRFQGRHIAVVRLTMAPYKEGLYQLPDSDWQEEGFEYLTQIGAKVDGLTPRELWDIWKQSPKEAYVVRFEIVDLT